MCSFRCVDVAVKVAYKSIAEKNPLLSYFYSAASRTVLPTVSHSSLVFFLHCCCNVVNFIEFILYLILIMMIVIIIGFLLTQVRLERLTFCTKES